MDNKLKYKTNENGTKYVPKYDLHGCTKKQACKEVYNVIIQCFELEISSITFITGRGNHQNLNGERAVLFKNFPVWLNDPKISSLIKDCKPGDGFYKVLLNIEENKNAKKNKKSKKDNKAIKEIKKNVKEIKEIKKDVKEIKENRKNVKEIKKNKEKVKEIKENKMVKKNKRKVKKNKKKDEEMNSAKSIESVEVANMEKKYVEKNNCVKDEPKKSSIFTNVFERISVLFRSEQFSPPPSQPSSKNNETSTAKPIKNTHFSQYYFNTYKVVKDFEGQGFTRGQAKAIMKAALTDLRTEMQMIRKNNLIDLNSENSLMQREVTSVYQKFQDDIGKMKHFIQLDINNYKADIREEQKKLEIKIQEINNKFTITYGDIRTDVEALKWETTRMALMGIFGTAVFALGVMFFISYKKSKEISTIKNAKSNNGSATNEILLNY
ncbi:5464_t:CDS:2 [Funneliformis caledonium]|uniref:5464_t:CDS:1 n=1 Tax=Funneliformis caledonium TaxID=1117310 RepID=A0A9N9DLZ0_9GLOM|nr:5464_t:CDS:2 [Funneliformis caledonium]